jgi:small GTP-binding protein
MTNSKSAETHLDLARESLRELIDDPRVPAEVREPLASDYAEVQAMLDKLEHGHVHVAVLGRVSVGKSSLLNALLGREVFSVSPLHGETRQAAIEAWHEIDAGGVFLTDTPGLDEIEGESREQLAQEVAGRSDMVLFVVEGDLTERERSALAAVAKLGRPVLLVLNKVDRYTSEERELLLASLKERTAGLVPAANIVSAAADPDERVYVETLADGSQQETRRQPPPDVEALRAKLWDVLEREGKTLAALNAGLFAGELSDKVAERLLATRRRLGERLVRTYCLAKGVAVALNPVPVADLFAAAFIDVGMIVHLSRLYDLPLTRNEAGQLVRTVLTQLVTLMGTVWAVHFVSSVLKLGTGGLSTALTAGAQGAVAYYGTYVVGKVTERYLVQGKSWGESGPRQAVAEILESLDRESILAEARTDITARLRGRSD